MAAISVVVPTFNRAAVLSRTLDALKRQTHAADLFEVIVVDDGSADDTPQFLARAAAEWKHLRFFRQENAGPAAARNLGIKEARHPIVAFTDDDCEPRPDWLERISQRFDAGVKGCLHGAILSSLDNGPFVHSVIAEGPMITSNLAIERRVFDEIGNFDTRFRAPWCEDADLFYQVKKARTPITYDAALIVDHPPRYQRYWSYLRKTRFLQYYALIGKKHPDMEPFSNYLPRLVLAAKKLAGLLFTAAVAYLLLSLPAAVALLVSPLPFVLMDGYRLFGIRSNLSRGGIRLRLSDQILYVLLNWTQSLAEALFLIKGALTYLL